MIRLRYFSRSGQLLDTAVIYRSGSSSAIPAGASWIEVWQVPDDQ